MNGKHLYTSDEKLKWWGPGEWIEEPDQFTFEHHGIKCRIVRVCKTNNLNLEDRFGGHFCGYIQIPADHKYFEKHYDEIDIEVHGGLTYFASEPDGYWIGFDCAHSFDVIPSMIMLKNELKKEIGHPESKIWEDFYRNLAFCMSECAGMADQLLASNDSRQSN